ncbi:MAG: hypothetical protein AAGC60_13185 [Acidobacteriota bacterium]
MTHQIVAAGLPAGGSFQHSPPASAISGGQALEANAEGKVETRVETMAERALVWIDGVLDEFHPFRDGRLFEIRHGQKLTELATFLRCRALLASDIERPEYCRMTRLLRAVQQDPRLMDRMMRSPAELILYLDIYIVLRDLGHEDERSRSLLQRVLDRGFLDHTERVPHRIMDVAASLEIGEFSTSLPPLEEIYRQSILGADPDVCLLEESAIYALTHAIMFLFAFGTRTPSLDVAKEAERLRPTLEVLCVRHAQDHQWDLLGEILLCAACLGLPCRGLLADGWDAFLAQQQDDGAIPGPERALREMFPEREPEEVMAGRFADLDADRRAAAYFDHCYHTTLVGMLAATVFSHRAQGGRLEPSSPSVRPLPVAAAPSPQPTPMWRTRRGFSRARVEEALATASTWIAASGVFDPVADVPAAARCRGLLGTWVAGASTLTGDDLGLWVSRFGDALSSDPSLDELPWPDLVVTSAIAAAYGADVPDLYRRAAALASAVRGVVGSPQVGAGETESLLAALGVLDTLRPVSAREALAMLDSFELTADSATVRRLIWSLDSATGFGTRELEVDAAARRRIVQRVQGLACHALAGSDLAAAAPRIRLLVHLDAWNALVPCLETLLFQQTPEGSFGFLGPEAHALAPDRDPAFTDAATRWTLRLPTTVACMVTLAESLGGWRLHRAVREPANLTALREKA